MPISVAILAPPPDWPNTMTRAGIAAERGDVVAHPVQREDQVELAGIAAVGEARIEPREIEIAEAR